MTRYDLVLVGSVSLIVLLMMCSAFGVALENAAYLQKLQDRANLVHGSLVKFQTGYRTSDYMIALPDGHTFWYNPLTTDPPTGVKQ